ncbi:MAG: hypothetical protein Q8R76_08905 [Candidatus Omnitrophota bacterium]|nr:hypothetical protein [Candidatus Omnitrophota bacterium]
MTKLCSYRCLIIGLIFVTVFASPAVFGDEGYDPDKARDAGIDEADDPWDDEWSDLKGWVETETQSSPTPAPSTQPSWDESENWLTSGEDIAAEDTSSKVEPSYRATPDPTPMPTPFPTPFPTPMPTPFPTPIPTPFPTPVPTPTLKVAPVEPEPLPMKMEPTYSQLAVPQVEQPQEESRERMAIPISSAKRKAPAKAEGPKNLFAEHFFMGPDQKLAYQTTELSGFVLVPETELGSGSRYSIVTDFGENVLRTRPLPNAKDVREIRKWFDEVMESGTFEGAEIRRLKLAGADGTEHYLYYVGHRGYLSEDKARGEIIMIKAVVEASGGDFKKMVEEAQNYIRIQIEADLPPQKTQAQFEKEEQLFLKYIDQLDIGNKLYGPFYGIPSGEPLVWQSFGETTWRQTNLDAENFADQVGFWTNRLVFKGIRFPLSTVDPFVEATAALESNGVDAASHLDLSAGLEWRPFQYNTFFYNFRPWGLPLLEWVKNYRAYVQYFNRKNLKGEIIGSRDYDLRAGVQIFYEWGVDLPPVSEKSPDSVPEFVRRYVWGEYFGDYRFEMTNFSSLNNFDAFIWNSSVILGFKLPGIPLPPNPFNDELVLMPYLHAEHVNNSEFSFPFQNRYFLGAGVRWMPFMSYRFKENEWLSKTKLFVEYVGVGGVQNAKQDGEAPFATNWDLRFGMSFSQRRF